MNNIKLNDYNGKFLPHAISDSIFFFQGRAAKIIECATGEHVVNVSDTGRNMLYTTQSGFNISSNGYVSKEQ